MSSSAATASPSSPAKAITTISDSSSSVAASASPASPAKLAIAPASVDAKSDAVAATSNTYSVAFIDQIMDMIHDPFALAEEEELEQLVGETESNQDL